MYNYEKQALIVERNFLELEEIPRVLEHIDIVEESIRDNLDEGFDLDYLNKHKCYLEDLYERLEEIKSISL